MKGAGDTMPETLAISGALGQPAGLVFEDAGKGGLPAIPGVSKLWLVSCYV